MYTPSAVGFFNITTTRVLSVHNSHTFCYMLFVVGWRLVFLFFVAPSLLQCFIKHLCSIRTCPHGIRGWWQIWIPVSVLSLPLCGHAFRCCVFEYTTTRVSSNHNSHTLCYFVLCLERYFFVVCGGLVFHFFVAPFSLLAVFAVFGYASVFNQDVSNWNTGAVITMESSKCNFASSLWPRLSCCVFYYTINWVSSFVNSHTFYFSWFWYFYCLIVTGCFFFLCCGTHLCICSVSWCTCVQFWCVKMEYGCGDNYASK